MNENKVGIELREYYKELSRTGEEGFIDNNTGDVRYNQLKERIQYFEEGDYGLWIEEEAPCIPNLPAPWSKVKKDVKVGSQAALLEGSKLTCAYGGQIEIVDPGQSILKE